MKVHSLPAGVDAEVGHIRSKRHDAEVLAKEFRLSHHAGTGSNDGFPIALHIPSQAKAGRERFVIGIVHIADRRSWADLLNRPSDIGVECGYIVGMLNGIPLVFPTQAEIQSDLRSGAEIILEKAREPVSAGDLVRIAYENGSAPWAAFEEVFQILEFDLAIGLVIGVVIVNQVHELEAELEGVFAVQP